MQTCYYYKSKVKEKKVVNKYIINKNNIMHIIKVSLFMVNKKLFIISFFLI